MKAFVVSEIDGEGVCSIVFHESAGKAKYYAMQNCEWFDCAEFTDLQVRREPKADEHATDEPSVLDFCGNAEVHHKLGWTCLTVGDCNKTAKECLFKKEWEVRE